MKATATLLAMLMSKSISVMQVNDENGKGGMEDADMWVLDSEFWGLGLLVQG